MLYELKVTNGNQMMEVNLKGKTYTFRILWRVNQYVLDISLKGAPIIMGIPLVSGNLLESLEYLNFPAKIYYFSNIIDPEMLMLSTNEFGISYYEDYYSVQNLSGLVRDVNYETSYQSLGLSSHLILEY